MEIEPSKPSHLETHAAHAIAKQTLDTDNTMKELFKRLTRLKMCELTVGEVVNLLVKNYKTNEILKGYKYYGEPLPNLEQRANGGVGSQQSKYSPNLVCILIFTEH